MTKTKISKKKEEETKKYLITYGMGGGYNDAERKEIVSATSLEQAKGFAYEKACEVFAEYDEPDEDMDDWIEHDAELYDEEKHKDVELYN